MITQSAALHFVDEHVPIALQTNTSDYGIGAYLTPKVDEVDRPIAIIDSTQLRWSTPEKEGYAMFYALKKLAYLLR